jgi:hypothetical protein
VTKPTREPIVSPLSPASPKKVWTPLEYDEVFRASNRGAWYIGAIGRLKPGVPAERAAADVAAIARRLQKQFPRSNTDVGFTGPDRGQGGSYLFLPPGHEREVPAGHHVVRLRTYRNWLLMRAVLLGMILDPFLNSSGGHPGLGIGIWIAFAGFIACLLPILLFLLMLFVDTWKIEATPELRAKYGKSIKWAILFFFMVGIVTPMWFLLLIGYFAYQGRYNKYVAKRSTHG